MLQPKKDNFRLNQADQAILEKEMIAYAEEGASDDDLIEFKNTYVAEKKKATPKSELASTPQKSVLGTPTGSSGGVNPAFKSSIPSPIPDFNSVESVKKPVVQKPAKINLKMPPVEEDESFMDYLKEGLDSGIAIASKSIYDAPALIYDNVAGLITNPIFRAMGVEEDKLASSKKLADNLGFKNIPSAILKEKIKVSNEKLNKYALKNGVDPLTAIENGEYKNAAKLVAGTTVQSLPMMVVALLSGGSKTALTAIGVSTASTKNSELEESNPEMGLGTRVVNANNAGIIEATTGHLFTGASGAVMKRIIADKGVEAGSKIIGKSFMATAEKAIEKNPFVSAFGEIVEESAVEFGNQVNDMSSGIRTEFDFHAIKNAGLSATGMGGLQTLGVYGAKGYVKAKDYAKLKSINKEVFKLRSEIDNGNLSPENKAILVLRADRLEAENKKLLGTEIEKAKALPTEQKAELNALNAEFEGLKTKFDDIDDADDIPDNLKPALKEEIRIQATKNQKRKTEILSQNDGLEVKDDFSKFEGVEPDFDLENGKISSLPLKEQDRLNKLAVEQITGGDKTIEYSKEQVSQTANEIYKNEQTPPTPEAQPQAEVPQQAEAEKVAEVSTVEDVVATSVDRKQPTNAKEWEEQNFTKDEIIERRKFGLTPEQEWEPTFRGTSVSEWETIQNGGEFKSEGLNGLVFTTPSKELAKQIGKGVDAEVIIEFKPESKSKMREGDSKYDSKEYYGDSLNKDDVLRVTDKEGNVIYEATPPTNTPTNGNVQLGASNVGESGATKPKSDIQKGVSSSVDGGEVKGDASVGKIIEPHSEVNTDVETVKKELKLNDVESLIYDEFKDVPKNEEEIYKKLEKVNDNLYGKVEAIESKINDIDIKLEDNGDAIDKIDEDETLSAAKKKKAIAVLEKEFKGLQNQQKVLESEKEDVNDLIKDISDKLYDWEAEENITAVNEIVDKVNNRLETRKSVKEGTNLFPEDANIPEFVAVKKELIKLTDEKTIADFNSRTAEQVKESEPIIADIKSKAKNAERISKEELEKGIADAEKLLADVSEKQIDKNNYTHTTQAEEFVKEAVKNNPDLKLQINAIHGTITGVGATVKTFKGYTGEFIPKESFELLKSRINEVVKNKLTSLDLVDKGWLTTVKVKEQSKTQEKKPTTKERISERIKLSDAKVDDVKAYIKGIDNIFGIKIKIDDVEGLNKNGIDFVEVIASIAKQAIAAGIHIDEAINKTIEHFKGKYDFDVNIDDIKERINPKKEADKADKNFKYKSGKKSLLGRLIEGGNPDVITKAVKELGENYDVRNQQEANDEAMAFIDKVGASEALKAIKDGLITNSDVKMLIYDEAITRLKTEISDEMNSNPEDREALIKKFQEVSDDFDRAIRDAGQGIAIMNYIYNKNQTLKYNLKKQIADWKRNDPNNEIPADIKAKYEELDQKLKDLEEKTKDAEVRAKKAEDELAIKNIQEDLERKSQASRKNKSGLTPQELSRKKQLKSKFFGRLNDATGLVTMLADPEFREYLGLTFKQAKGDFANFSNEILKELGKGARKHLPELFKEAGGKGDVKVTDLQSINISEEGKIKIPAQMLRDYVEQGYTDIDEIAALIKDDIADEFPDADVRDIRDALTGYGKQINPNKDEITAQVNKLKEYGRLLSAYDDVMNGEMPKKSGLVRPKSEQKARELRRNINRLAKELNLEPVDLENQWANAVDKVKSHLKNQIEDLDKQIANGEKRKVDRTPIKLDEEATALKAIRDAKKQILDDLVGKPELTEEQKIANAEKSLDNSIKKLQEEIDTNDIAFKEKPTAVTSKKIEQLKANKKALLETKKQLRQEAGLIEQQRLKTTKTRIKNQIEDLNTRIKNKDFAKKEVKPILADSELNTLRAEKEAVYEEYEKMKYLQELKNRTFAKKLMDEGLEALGLARAIKASLDLGLIGIQLRGFTYSELWRNPKELAHKFIKMFGAIGSQNKTNKAMSELIGHPLHALAKKLDIGMTHPDLRNEVREEMASGNLLHFIWSSPVLAIEALGGKEAMNSKRTSIGDSFIDAVKKQYNKLFQNYQVDIKQKEKFSVKEQWKNINAFEAVERGLSIYGNQLRFEEFVRGVDRLKAEGKDEINHLEDYKELASYIRTFSGRAKPMGFELNQKALNVFFFSFKNMASVIQQLNPYYMLIELNKSNLKRGVYKPTVANKMAMATMFKSVVSTSATLLFVMAAYNAFKDDDEEEATIEKDPRSSDFGKLKIGNFRYDPWGGYIPLISLYARLATEEVKKSDGTISKFGEDRFGIQNRGDAASRFLINKESPGFQMFHKYMTSTEEVDKATGETYRATPFGGKLSEEDAYSFYPIFLGSVKSAKEKDYEGVQAFLTAYSILGLGNVQEYETKEKKPKSSKKGAPGVPNFGRMKINP